MRDLLFRRWLLPVAAVMAGCSSSAEPSLLGHDEAGPDPFLAIDGAVPPADLDPILGDATEAADTAEAALLAGDGGEVSTGDILDTRLEAISDALAGQGIGFIRPRSAVGVPLLPGDGVEICDLDEMIEQFESDREIAEAFASVHGIAATSIGEYLRSLTAGYVLDTVDVISYGFSGGFAQPYDTTLVAGTAMLVDRDGLPRVRCRCANPLQPAMTELDGQIIETNAFADRVVDAEIAQDVPGLVESSIDGVFTDDPEQVLGPPDRTALALGDDHASDPSRCRYYVTVEFVDNRLVDGPGDDLQIIELGRTESTFVSVGATRDDLRFVGEITGGTGRLDLAGVVEQGEELAFVRLCDGPDSASEVPGSDIDAVAALNSVRS
jgi:hypothetical protein